MGFVTTIVLLCVLIFYSAMQLYRLNYFGETLVTTSMSDSHFDTDFQVTSEQHGLKFAFALTAYDS